MVLMLDVTLKSTGCTVGIPVNKEEAKLVKNSAYWRAAFFRIGLGLPADVICEKDLKTAVKEDYGVSIMDRGRVIWSQ